MMTMWALLLALLSPDTVYLNAIVVTMDAAATEAQAVAVDDGKIVAVGDNATIEAMAGPETKRVDLDGAVLLPGFYAAHDHFPGSDHPIFITHISGHLGVANSLALEMAGITRDTPEPPGGVIRKDPETGEPNGVFEESSSLVTRLAPSLNAKDRLETIRWSVEDYVEEGVTTTVIAGGSKSSFLDLQYARRDGLLSLRVVMMGRKGSLEHLSPGEAGGFVSGFGDERLKLGAVKLVQDGSIQGYTGYLVEPYHAAFMGDAGYRGYPRRDREELVEMVKLLHRAGYQIAIHGNGDAAIDDILYAYREAQKDFPREDARHRIEHCQMAREDQLDEMKELGISPSFFVGHDDTPVTPVKPLQLVWDAVNRITTSGKVLGPEQRITPREALRAVTIDAAWQNHEERSKGSIEVGKLADFVVLEENPLSVAPEHIRDIRVLTTIVGDEVVYVALIPSALADLALATHLAFIFFIVLGALLVARWPRLVWAHLPAAVWGVLIELGGWTCPLTPLENWLRRRAGERGYETSFVEHYLLPVIYPDALTRNVQFVLAALVLVANVALYAFVVRRYAKGSA